MSRAIMLIPTETSIGLTSIILGISYAIECRGVSSSFFKAISQSRANEMTPDNSDNNFIYENLGLLVNDPLKMDYVESLVYNNQRDLLIEEIIAKYHVISRDSRVILIEGLAPTRRHNFTQLLNFEIAKSLNAEIIFVLSEGNESLEQIEKRIKLIINAFGGIKNNSISGVIINKINAPISSQIYNCLFSSEIYKNLSKTKVEKIDLVKLQSFSPLPVKGAIPWNLDLISIRVIDIAHYLKATIINEGNIKIRRVKSILPCICSISNMLKQLYSESILVISANRPDLLIAACLATLNGLEIGSILITDSYELDAHISKLCEKAFATDLPVLMVANNTWQICLSLQNFNLKLLNDDQELIEKVKKYVAKYINSNWIEYITTTPSRIHFVSPPVFRYQLVELARKANKRIVLPEGEEPRTVKAAAICAKRGIAKCVLLGNPDKIRQVAVLQNVKLNSDVEIINSKLVRENYITRLVELRKNKGMTETKAREQLEDDVMLGTMMLERDEVDGLVSGAVHTTANTIRPSLQLFKTTPDNSLVSSIFFMLMPEQVYIYGDCAINPNPSIEQLAEIAIQSAESAITFGIEPRIAMLSYSTGTSSVGADVEKVREATSIVQKKRPDLIIDGPLQYDAAAIVEVAKSKAPNSLVAGRATVFIFPDLNTGNITYKAVQRSAGLVSIGPMLQGMRKPVNDLSRGALVDDIVYTIALTAIQSSIKKKESK